jgi:hypothetical protein
MTDERPQRLRDTQTWLADWQAGFGEMLRTVLDTRTGSLRAQPERYPPRVVGGALPGPRITASERLAVYNRQYWFRLFSVLHNELPLTSRLLGFWFFNQVALDFLRAHPPRHHDLRLVTEGFEAYLARRARGELVELAPGAPRLPRAALLSAAELDLSFARVFAAPEQPALDLSRSPPETLPELRLMPSAAYTRFVEAWPLVALRHKLSGDRSEAPEPLPVAHDAPRHWVIFRNDQGVVNAPLAREQARLYELLEQLPLGAALGQLEREAGPARRDSLPELCQGWLAQAARHGFFCAPGP